MGIDYAERARALVGTPFRPQGRGPEGLDCVGLAIATFDVPTDSVRRNYRLRGDYTEEVLACLGEHFRRVASAQLRSGDLMALKVSADQLHLAIRTDAGFVHAHARLRLVVETPGMPPWGIVGIFRRRGR